MAKDTCNSFVLLVKVFNDKYSFGFLMWVTGEAQWWFSLWQTYLLVPTWGWGPCPMMRQLCLKESNFILVETWPSFVCMVVLDLSVLSGIFSGSLDGRESACSAGELGSSLDREDPLEKRMATEYSILAWRIPWTAEAERLQSMWSQTVRHVWMVNTLISQSCLNWLCLDKTACFLQWKYWPLTIFCVHGRFRTLCLV